jgi:DNA repair ATPase RecN
MKDFNLIKYLKENRLVQSEVESSDVQINIPDNASYEDFAKKVASILKSEYGERDFLPFLKTLESELGDSPEELSTPPTSISEIDSQTSIALDNIKSELEDMYEKIMQSQNLNSYEDKLQLVINKVKKYATEEDDLVLKYITDAIGGIEENNKPLVLKSLDKAIMYLNQGSIRYSDQYDDNI